MTAREAREWLPETEELRRLCQSLAALDAILCPEWEFRYFSFNSEWAPGEMLSSMRNGEGDDWLILWNRHGAIIKGFVHDAPMAEDCPWPGVLDRVPGEFTGFLDDPTTARRQTTFCLWRRPDDDGWCVGDFEPPDADEDPDGARKLLHFLDGDPETYRQWGEEYFGVRLNPNAVEHLYRHLPLTPFVVRSLNPEVDLRELEGELRSIGYPT